MNHIKYRIKEPISNKGDYSFSIIRIDDRDSFSEPQTINIALQLDSDKEGWSYHYFVFSDLPEELAYLGQELEYNRRTTGNKDLKSTLRHALSQLTDLMENLGDSEARELLNSWFNKQF